MILKDFPYGDYKARVVDSYRNSVFTYWKVIDVNVEIDPVTKYVRFHSKNAFPIYLDFMTLSRVRLPEVLYDFSEKKGVGMSRVLNHTKSGKKRSIYKSTF